MLIDCDTCAIRGTGCGDCMVSTMVGAPPPGVELDRMPSGVELDAVELRALRALAEGGLAPEFVSVTANTANNDNNHADAERRAAHRPNPARRAG